MIGYIKETEKPSDENFIETATATKEGDHAPRPLFVMENEIEKLQETLKRHKDKHEASLVDSASALDHKLSALEQYKRAIQAHKGSLVVLKNYRENFKSVEKQLAVTLAEYTKLKKREKRDFDKAEMLRLFEIRKEERLKNKMPVSNGISMPKEGTLGNKIWGVCDKLFLIHNTYLEPSMVVDYFEKQFVDPLTLPKKGTIKTEFSKWKTFKFPPKIK